MIRTFSAIFGLYLIVSGALAYGTASALHRLSRPAGSGAAPLAYAPAAAGARYLVLMVLDGARPDYFDLTTLPTVNALRSAGTQFTNAVSGILEAETPAGHATISTGSRPDRDGILGFDWANDDDRFSLFNPKEMPDLERILLASGAPTIGALYKHKYPGARVVALSGHKYYAAAPLGGPSADAIIYYKGSSEGRYIPVAVPGHEPPAGILTAPDVIAPSTHLPDGAEDHLVTNMAVRVVTRMRPRLLLINYPEFDWPVGHVDGGIADPQAVTVLMKEFNADLARIEQGYRKAGILDQTVFAVTADHGMMPISRFVPSTEINDAVSAAGTTAPDIASNSGDFIWLADPSRAEAVAENVMNANDPAIQSAYYLGTAHGKVAYLPANAANLDPQIDAANRYLLSSLLNGHEPAVVLVGNEGTSFSNPTSGWKADHGGNSWQSQHIPFILAGPGIRRGVVSNAPVQLDDLAPTLLSDMGVRPTGMEGHILSDALLAPTAVARTARAAEVAHLGGILAALNDQAPVQADGN